MAKITCPSPQTLAVLAVVGCVLLAGCSGWGGDDPADDPEDDESDDLEEADDDADETQEDSPDPGDDERDGDDPGDVDESPPPEDDDDAIEDEDDPEADPADDDAAPEEDDDTEADPTDDDDEDADEEPTEEVASADDVRVANVTHMESESDLNHDEVTLHNTNDEHPLPIGGWEIEMDGEDQRVTIDERTILEPGEAHTIQFDGEGKVLDADGGVIHFYDADGDHVGSWDHIGSPSSPPEENGESDVGYVLFEVVDTETDERIDDAVVILDDGDDRLTGTTDGAGVTTIQEVPYGEYELTVEHDQYTTNSETITVNETAIEMTIELTSIEENHSQVATTKMIGMVGR